MEEFEKGLQKKWLQKAMDEKITVTVYLNNGYRMSGIVEEFDLSSMLLHTESHRKLVSLDVVSTVVFREEDTEK